MEDLDFFDDPATASFASELAREAGVFDALDERVQAFRGRMTDVLDRLAQARTARDAARRVREYPRAHLATLERAVESAKTAVAVVGTALVNAAEDRAQRAASARTAALNAALARPAGVEQTADRLDLQEARAYLHTLDPAERAIRLKRHAQEGDRPDLVRAALTAVAPVVGDRDAREIRERLIAQRAPDTVRDAFAVRQLRKFASELTLARDGYTPFSLARPAPTLRDGPGGVKVLDDG
jgi:hypothetical protein